MLQNEEAQSQLEEVIKFVGMIGRPQKLAKIARTIKSAAVSNCNVVIFGETGTGKELIARTITYALHAGKNSKLIYSSGVP